MSTYKYQAISRSGERVSGVIEGFNELDAATRIKESCDVVLRLTQVREKDAVGILNMEIGGAHLDPKAFTVMCNQFAIILRAGIPVSRTVHLVADKTTDKTLKRMLRHVAEDVENGRNLSASFADRGGKLLPQTFVETIRAGEESGSVDKSFQSMAEHYDKQTKLRSKVRGAMAYPAFVLVLAVAVVAVLMIVVIPKLMPMFEDMGTELPAPTKVLIAVSNFFTNYWMILVIVLAALLLAWKLYGATESGRLKLARLSLKLPVLGNIGELNAASQFANSMTTMLSAGIPITKAISITAKVLDNYYISNEVGKLAAKLEEGYALGASMRESGCMPDILTDMVAVGEETGEMEETLRTIAAYYDQELQMATDAALKKLEPALLIGLAGVAGFIVISIYLAMFSMYGAL